MNFIKHTLNKDVCFQVYEMDSLKDHYEVRGMWWNINVGDPFPIENETIKIKIEDFKHWKEYDPRTAKTRT